MTSPNPADSLHLRADMIPGLCESGFYFQITRGRKLSSDYHNHDFFEIICVESGACRQRVGNVDMLFSPGSMVLICPGTYHRLYDQIEATNVIALSVRSNVMQLFSDAYDINLQQPIIQLNTEKLYRLNRLCERIQISDGKITVKYARLLLGYLMTCFVEAEIQKDRSSIPKSFEHILAQMNHLEMIAEGIPAFLRISNFSYSQLNRLTKQYLAMTPGEYVTSLRLQYAYEMIAHGDENFEAICDTVGFSSFSHFTKLIRHRYGMTPARIRNNAKKHILTI